jgi:hypothetical protein
VRLRALVTHEQASWQRYATVEDIGLGGARLVLDGLSAGDAVTISIATPTLWDPLLLRARVAWAATGDTEKRAGIAFEHDDERAVLALYELIVSLGFD